jgi:hypothetical protein
MTARTQNGFELPEGTAILHREDPEPSVELGLELAHLGASESMIRAVGGDQAVAEIQEYIEATENGTAHDAAQASDEQPAE